jgi:serine/threonine protein kinase
LGEFFHAVINEEPNAPIEFAEMPEEFSNLILMMLAKNPKGRPSSAEQVVDLLDTWQVPATTSFVPPPPETNNDYSTASALSDPRKLAVYITLGAILCLLLSTIGVVFSHNVLSMSPVGKYFESIASMLVIASAYSVLHYRLFRDVLGLNQHTSFIEVGIRLGVMVYSSFLVIIIGLSPVIDYKVIENSITTAGELGLTSFWCISSLTPCSTEFLTPTKYGDGDFTVASTMMILLFTYLLNWGAISLLIRTALCSTDLDRLCNSDVTNRLSRFVMIGFITELLIVEISSVRFGESSSWLPLFFGLGNLTTIYIALFNIKNAKTKKVVR